MINWARCHYSFLYQATRVHLITKNRRIQPRSQDFSPLPPLSKEPCSRLHRIFCTCIKGLSQQHLKEPLNRWILCYFKASVTKYKNPDSVNINLPPSLAALWFVRLTSRATKIALLDITKVVSVFLRTYYVGSWYLQVHSNLLPCRSFPAPLFLL